MRIRMKILPPVFEQQVEKEDNPNHVRNHLKKTAVHWSAVLIHLMSGRLAEGEQVLCKLPAQPCKSITPLPWHWQRLFVYFPYVPYVKPALGTVGKGQTEEAAGTCAGRGDRGGAGGKGPLEVCGFNQEQGNLQFYFKKEVKQRGNMKRNIGVGEWKCFG